MHSLETSVNATLQLSEGNINCLVFYLYFEIWREGSAVLVHWYLKAVLQAACHSA